MGASFRGKIVQNIHAQNGFVILYFTLCIIVHAFNFCHLVLGIYGTMTANDNKARIDLAQVFASRKFFDLLY